MKNCPHCSNDKYNLVKCAACGEYFPIHKIVRAETGELSCPLCRSLMKVNHDCKKA